VALPLAEAELDAEALAEPLAEVPGRAVAQPLTAETVRTSPRPIATYVPAFLAGAELDGRERIVLIAPPINSRPPTTESATRR